MSIAEVNRKFYDLVARGYDRADGRRGKAPEWLDTFIKTLAQATKAKYFLDIGAGTGYVSLVAAKYFIGVTAYDISQKMLDYMPAVGNIALLCGPAEKIPMEDNFYDVVCTFAVLHHIEDHAKIFKEISRVLRPGGIYYSDHDIEEHFVERHRLLLKIYRVLRNQRRKFARIHPEADSLYDMAEWWNGGIDANDTQIALSCAGFKSYVTYHWQGVLPIQGDHAQGKAPIMRIIGIKQ